eukprot:500809_1
MSYSLHTKWEGVWEIHGNSARNGDRMIITFNEEKKCLLTDARSLERYTLSAEPTNNLRAHWHKHPSGKVQRYYIGILANDKGYDEIEWSEMRKNRKVKWIRIDEDHNAYLKHCHERNKRKPKHHTKASNRIVRRKNHQNGTNYSLTPVASQVQSQSQPKQKYVLKKQINDPAIVDMIEYNENDTYQTEHRPLKNNQFYVDRYPNDDSPPRPQHKQSAVPPINWKLVSRLDLLPRLPDQDKASISHKTRHHIHHIKLKRAIKYSVPRRTVLRHDEVHQPRQKIKKKDAQNAAVLDAYFTNEKNTTKRQRKRDRHKFSKYLSKTEVDRILEDTKTLENPVLYMGEISISRFNPNVSYVSVDGLDRDIRISGFVDRNRAFHEDTVVVSLYPQIEWMSAIKPEIKEFQDRLDERDRLKSDNSSSSNSSEEEQQQKKKSNKRRARLEDLVDSQSITAYDYYLFLKDAVSDFSEFDNKWGRDFDLLDAQHPRRQYIDQVMAKCGGKKPSEALESFEWDNPKNNEKESIARGRVLAIYESNKSSTDKISGFLLPIIYNDRGAIDRKWAQFTPFDKRYPKAMFPMRELPSSVRELVSEFEREEMSLIEEYENRRYDLRAQGLRHKQKEIKKRNNEYAEKLKLQCFSVYFEARWPHHSFQPICHLSGELGKRGAVEVETNIILTKHKIKWRDSFSAEIEEYVSKLAICESDFVGRRDCRDLRVFSIDPTSARDFDDALSIEFLEDRNGLKLYNVGIHIADVTHFVSPGSVVDREAQRRATSVYMVDRCLPMLPHHLCQNLCSLNPAVDRLAYSVFVILNENGHLVTRPGESPWFGKSVIRSRARLNYETAHWMLTGKVDGDTPLHELHECCHIDCEKTSLAEIVADTRLFWSIAKQMRERRFAGGSAKFFRSRLRFRLDKKDEHKALVFGPEILLWSNHLIEEMMLLANQLVAHRLMGASKEHTLLRRHPAPLDKNPNGMKLQLLCRSQGFELRYDTAKQLNESLEAMQNKMYGGISAAQVINSMASQFMSKAEYIIVEDMEASSYGHWALNFPMYTHFTSPIRRYADVIVHRLLTDKLPDIKQMKKQVSTCNVRNRAAHYAQMESQEIHLCLLLIERPVIVDALLVDIINTKMFILVVPGLGIDVRVHCEDLIKESQQQIVSIDKEFELPDSKLIIEWKSGRIEEYNLFDKMRIQITSKLKIPIKPVTKLIEPQNRKHTKAANADAFNNEEDEEEEDEEDYKTNNDFNAPPPVAMTLDSQLKIGTDDYHAGYYD